jgi:hypothetical protein
LGTGSARAIAAITIGDRRAPLRDTTLEADCASELDEPSLQNRFGRRRCGDRQQPLAAVVGIHSQDAAGVQRVVDVEVRLKACSSDVEGLEDRERIGLPGSIRDTFAFSSPSIYAALHTP